MYYKPSALQLFIWEGVAKNDMVKVTPVLITRITFVICSEIKFNNHNSAKDYSDKNLRRFIWIGSKERSELAVADGKESVKTCGTLL